LHELRLHRRQLERFAELLHQDVGEVVGHSPDEKKCRNQRKGAYLCNRKNACSNCCRTHRFFHKLIRPLCQLELIDTLSGESHNLRLLWLT
jgi:hypothetical protein